MKRIAVFLLIALALSGCILEAPTPSSPPVNPIDVPPDNPPIEDPTGLPVSLALYDGNKLMFWDGDQMVTAYEADIDRAGSRSFAIDDVLYYFDDAGATSATDWLPVNPDAVRATNKDISLFSQSAVVYADSVWTLEDIDPDEAYSLGALYKHYTRIFRDGEEVGAWYLHEWEVSEVVNTLSGHVIARDALSAYHNLTDDRDVFRAWDAGLLIYDYDSTNNTAWISDSTGDYYLDWQYNYFLNYNGLALQFANGKWHGGSGCTWTPGDAVSELTSATEGFNEYPYPVTLPAGERPIVIAAGVRYENGEECPYWIECNTGYLFREVPSLGRLDEITRLYNGSGMRSVGIIHHDDLLPVYSEVEDALYFHEGGVVRRYDFATGLIETFSDEMEVWGW